MNTMVTTENFPTELCSREAKEQFARAVLKERANKRKLQVLVAGGPEYNYIYHRSRGSSELRISEFTQNF